MTKSELTNLLKHKNGQLNPDDIELAVNAILNAITHTLEKGDRIEVRGFGSYQLSQHDSRLSRNPKTGQEFLTSEKRVIRFRPAKALRERINNNRKKYDIH